MIIPIGHENLRGRRWPWVTTGIIVLCSVIFLVTNSPMDEQLAQPAQIRTATSQCHWRYLSRCAADARRVQIMPRVQVRARRHLLPNGKSRPKPFH